MCENFSLLDNIRKVNFEERVRDGEIEKKERKMGNRDE